MYHIVFGFATVKLQSINALLVDVDLVGRISRTKSALVAEVIIQCAYLSFYGGCK